MRTVAAALGIAPVSLRRWARDVRFRPVRVVEAMAPVDARAAGNWSLRRRGVRVEGADVETAAQLIARLR